MIVNPDKSHAIIVKKDRSDTTGINIRIKGQNLKIEFTVKRLGVKFDYKLNFDPQISSLCRRAANQLNFVKRVKFQNKESSSSEFGVFKFQLLATFMAFLVC